MATPNPTPHFTYTHDGSTAAEQRSFALAATCEADLARLEALFDAAGGFANGNTCEVRVAVPASGGLAENAGYHSDGTTKITVTPWAGVTPAATADDGARMEFVAEMAEVLMSLRNQRASATTWNPGGSNGEGLSQVCAAELYPTAYYDAQLKHGPSRIKAWLNGGRPDWVTTTEPTDGNNVSYGCAEVFIYFLVSQKRFSLHDVIVKAGADLEATYKNLTGTAGGWNEFSALLERFFPSKDGLGNPIKHAPPSCNLFPLLDDWRRDVDLAFATVAGGVPKALPGGEVFVAPCVLAETRLYWFEWIEPNTDLVCTISTRGFGNPVVSLKIGGVPVPAAGGTVTVSTDVGVDQPAHPFQPATSPQTVHLNAAGTKDVSTFKGHAFEVRLSPVEHPGHEHLFVEATVTERYAAVPPEDGWSWQVLDTRFVRYAPDFYADREECERRWRKFETTHVHYRHINILLTLPDPPPEVIAIARALQELRVELARLVREEPEISEAVIATVARTLRLPPAALAGGLPELAPLRGGG